MQVEMEAITALAPFQSGGTYDSYYKRIYINC